MTGLEVAVGEVCVDPAGQRPGAVTGWIWHKVRAPYPRHESTSGQAHVVSTMLEMPSVIEPHSPSDWD